MASETKLSWERVWLARIDFLGKGVTRETKLAVNLVQVIISIKNALLPEKRGVRSNPPNPPWLRACNEHPIIIWGA